MRTFSLLACLALALSCSPNKKLPSQARMPVGPYVVVLGTAQDAGLPQIGSDSPGSRRARSDPGYARLVSSLLIVDPATGQRWLIDCTPDLRQQVEMARPHPSSRRVTGPRPPLFDGIFLTHAHVGHYAGLIQLGREAYAAKGVPVYASESMRSFLSSNGPWDLLVRLKNIALHSLKPGNRITLSPSISIEPLLVPHRAEYTDTLGFIVRGESRSLLYVPDIDKWQDWDQSIEELVASVDVALIDGTFFGDDEIPGRSMADIPHPFISESLARFERLAAEHRSKIIFTHLNHSNPVADPASQARRAVERAGMRVAEDGQFLSL